jgi:hypothetical protein
MLRWYAIFLLFIALVSDCDADLVNVKVQSAAIVGSQIEWLLGRFRLTGSNKGQFRQRFHHPLSYCCPATFFRDILAALCDRLRAVKGRCRMTDAVIRKPGRPSDRDRIITTGPSRFQPAGPEVLR